MMSHCKETFLWRSVGCLLAVGFVFTILGVNGCPTSNLNGPPCANEPGTFQGRDLVTLDGSQSSDPEGSQLRFNWTQLTGTDVQLSNPNAAITTFTAPNVEETMTFRLNVTDTFGAVDTCVATVIVHRVCDLLANAGQDKSIGIRGTTTLDGSATCGFPPYSYSWQQVNGPLQTLTNTTSATATVTALNVGASVFRLSVTDSIGTTATGEATVTVNCDVPTVIVVQPVNQQVCPEQAANFSVQATGQGDLSYQWRRGTTNLADGNGITGARGTILSIASASENDESTDYNCVVTGLCGSVTSTNATLVVDEPTVITQQPNSITRNEGSSATFTVAATGTGTLTYQWQLNGNNLTEGNRFTNVTSPTLNISNVDTDIDGLYRCVVTGACGTVTSNPARLTVRIDRPPPETQPE